MEPKYILYDTAFEKRFKKYKNRLTDAEKDKLRLKLSIFKENIFDSRLKTHKLKGNLNNYYSFSVSYSHRIVFKVLEDGGVYFMEIGSHDICY